MNSPTHVLASENQHGYLSLPVLFLMAAACGLCAGGNYFNQPLLHSIASNLNVTQATAAMAVTIAQVSYALGLLFLVPLGDTMERKRLTVCLMTLAAVGQFISGFAVNITMLFMGTTMAGLFSVAAQVLVPMASTLSDPRKSGRAVGLVMSGLLSGILLARSVAGLLSDLGGWNTVYRVAGVAMLILAALLWRQLPQSRNRGKMSYPRILGSMVTLLREQPRLRSQILLGVLSFASVSVLFSTMALLLAGPNYGLSDTSIGLIGLAGLAGAMMASAAGRLSDQGKDQIVTIVCVLLLILSWGLLWLGAKSLWWFIIGILICDMALQGIHITNQTIIYKIVPEARSRINAAYMTCYFIGAASGSALGALAWGYAGWAGTCAMGILLAALAGLAFFYDKAVAAAGA